MKKRSRLLLLLLLLLSFQLSFSQKVIKYNYFVNGDSTDNKPYLGMEAEFSTVRKYYNDTLFKESRLFTGSKNDFIYYRIVDQVWYYKFKNNWNLFFDYNKKLGGKIHILDHDYNIMFDGEVNIRNKKYYKIFFQPINFSPSHNLLYFFDPKEGIILIKTSSGIILTRNGYFKYPLSDDEIDLL